jgi:NAD+ synthase (glutamine-hydrolysing)
MRLIQIALCNINTTVGAVRSNAAKVLAAATEAASAGATVCLFPEQTLSGYAPEDLVQWGAFVALQWQELRAFAAKSGEPALCKTVFAVGLTVAYGDALYNAAAVVHAGKVLGVVPKEKLPTYNVFYEARTLGQGAPGLVGQLEGVPFGDLLFRFDFGTLGVEVCEDLWSADGPMRRRSYQGAELVCNLSASPFRVAVDDTRREMIATRASDNQCTLAYVNLVGANDGLVFDGGGFVSQNGRLVLESGRFRTGIQYAVVDLDRTARLRRENTTWRHDQAEFRQRSRTQEAGSLTATTIITEAATERARLRYPVPSNQSFFLPAKFKAGDADSLGQRARKDFCEDLLDALALGIQDYFEKTRAFKTIGIALSGGRDSLLCLILARRAVDRMFAGEAIDAQAKHARRILRAFFMPSRYSSEATSAAAEQAARDMGAQFAALPIDVAFEQELLESQKMLCGDEQLTKLTRQNAQARVRAARMWNWSNSASGLFLQTSNMSEKAVGYTTIGGDMEGALSVLANVPKTVVNYLLDYLYELHGWEGIALTLKKAASAELADDQEDERDLMPFPVLDACFALYAGEKMAPEEVLSVLCEMFPEHEKDQLMEWTKKFARSFTQSIYKWVQTPLTLHVGNLDLDRERALQLPVVQHTEWHWQES